MNNSRRKELEKALKLLDEAQEIADQARGLVEQVCDEEQEAYDNLPESFQNGERGEAMQAAISGLESAELEDVFADARSYIEEALS